MQFSRWPWLQVSAFPVLNNRLCHKRKFSTNWDLVLCVFDVDTSIQAFHFRARGSHAFTTALLSIGERYDRTEQAVIDTALEGHALLSLTLIHVYTT
jgi:hypothetical protein